jgi:hypothetical protein
MASAPSVLLDTSIENLRTLARFFTDELGNCGRTAPVASPQARACREALLTISVLIPKLQAARYLVADAAEPTRRCPLCDGD